MSHTAIWPPFAPSFAMKMGLFGVSRTWPPASSGSPCWLSLAVATRPARARHHDWRWYWLRSKWFLGPPKKSVLKIISFPMSFTTFGLHGYFSMSVFAKIGAWALHFQWIFPFETISTFSIFLFVCWHNLTDHLWPSGPHSFIFAIAIQEAGVLSIIERSGGLFGRVLNWTTPAFRKMSSFALRWRPLKMTHSNLTRKHPGSPTPLPCSVYHSIGRRSTRVSREYKISHPR